MLTARGRWTIALGLVAGLAGRILGIPELFGLAAAAVVITLVSLVRVRMTRAEVTVRARAVPPVVAFGEAALLELSIEESSVAGSLASAVVLFADESASAYACQPEKIIVPRLSRGEWAGATFALSTHRRGVVEAGAYEAAVTDPLGLVRRPIATCRAVSCVVLPRVEPLATVVPRGLGWTGTGNMRSAAERLISGSSTLRRYVQGDDLRLVHWHTTARVGALMVREGGDRQDPERIATTVLLDTGDETTPPDDLDRAVEVAASVLSAAADASDGGVSGAWRLVTTAGLDTGPQHGYEDLQDALIALAGVASSPGSARERFAVAARGLRRPDEDEVLVIVGAFGGSPPDQELLDDIAAAYFGAVLVLVGAGAPSPEDGWHADAGNAGSQGVLGIHPRPGPPRTANRHIARTGTGLLTVTLPAGRSLAAAWGLEPAAVQPPDALTGRAPGAEVVAR
ncbi:MAG: DUF58 domain-containing protein [Acidimicrobiales bacterium]|jgi:uncharacterized protein (DUF58 family)